MPSLLKMQVEELGNEIERLPERDRAFASSLCEQFWRRGLSEKQAPWVERLLERARNPQAAPAKAEAIGDLSGLLALFAKAKEHLKYPAIVIKLDCPGEAFIRINVAGEKARVPGSLNVADGGPERNEEGRREWFGRVRIDGTYEPARAANGRTEAITAKLRELAADPAKAAKQHAKATERIINGQLTGLCCFCNQLLTDPRSTEMGYGPICAGHYGLPWGKREASNA